MAEKDRVGYVDVSCELLAESLHLPEGTEIVREYPSPFGGCVRFLVRHRELREINPHCSIPTVNPTVKIVSNWIDV